MENFRFQKEANLVKHFSKIKNTGSNQTLLILEDAWSERPSIGDELAVYGSNNNLNTSVVYVGNHTGLSLWGDDLYTEQKDGLTLGESFEIRLWDASENKEYLLSVEEWAKGEGAFEQNGLSVVKEISYVSFSSTDVLLDVYPNPVNTEANITFELKEDFVVHMELLNFLGQVVRSINNMTCLKGENLLLLNVQDLPSGIYNLKIYGAFGESLHQISVIE
tara:strand:- start:210 stop:869 length:660 start_codon:yes stop_codon:yes gene_type:complete